MTTAAPLAPVMHREGSSESSTTDPLGIRVEALTSPTGHHTTFKVICLRNKKKIVALLCSLVATCIGTYFAGKNT
jgi:ribulose 1,5-bisphosphate synthetase/thiazole synthase